MKKIYVVIFVILLFGMKSCISTEHEVIFLRNEKLSTIRESSLINSIQDSKFKFKSVVLNSEEEFGEYVKENLESKKIGNKTFIISEEFSNLVNINDESIYSNLVYINGVEESRINLKIDQIHLSYIFGVISGMLTRTNNVAIIYESELKDCFENVLSFVAGVKNVNLRAYDLLLNGENVLNLNSLSEEDKISNLESFIKNSKSDLIFYLDNQLINNAVNISEEVSKTLFTLNEFQEELFVSGSYLYEDILSEIISSNGEFRTYNINILDNTIDINIEGLPEEINQVVRNILDRMKNGNITFPSTWEELKSISN